MQQSQSTDRKSAPTLPALLAASALALATSLAGVAPAFAASGDAGAVYVLTNNAADNQVAVFARGADGSLASAGGVSTGGLGSGAGLGSQGSLVLSSDQQWLFAVNAGSNEVSAFAVTPGSGNGLTLAAKASSGGTRPISLTTYKKWLYVLNAGGSGNITGFTIGKHGALTPLAGSTRLLSNNGVGAAPGPAQVSFSPDGEALVVTEKGTNQIDVYTVDKNGLASGPAVFASAGATPFGFAFDKRGHLIVSEAFGGAPNGSATSSYALHDGALSVVSGSVHTNLTAACWVAVTGNGKYAYVTDAGSQSITGYRIGHNGSLTLLNADGRTGTTAATPVDMAVSANSRFLYALNAGGHSLSLFAVNEDGSLSGLGELGGLPTTAVGLAAR